jgi:hypothetical protein
VLRALVEKTRLSGRDSEPDDLTAGSHDRYGYGLHPMPRVHRGGAVMTEPEHLH